MLRRLSIPIPEEEHYTGFEPSISRAGQAHFSFEEAHPVARRASCSKRHIEVFEEEEKRNVTPSSASASSVSMDDNSDDEESPVQRRSRHSSFEDPAYSALEMQLLDSPTLKNYQFQFALTQLIGQPQNVILVALSTLNALKVIPQKIRFLLENYQSPEAMPGIINAIMHCFHLIESDWENILQIVVNIIGNHSEKLPKQLNLLSKTQYLGIKFLQYIQINRVNIPAYLKMVDFTQSLLEQIEQWLLWLRDNPKGNILTQPFLSNLAQFDEMLTSQNVAFKYIIGTLLKKITRTSEALYNDGIIPDIQISAAASSFAPGYQAVLAGSRSSMAIGTSEAAQITHSPSLISQTPHLV